MTNAERAEKALREVWPYENDPNHPGWKRMVGAIQKALDEAVRDIQDQLRVANDDVFETEGRFFEWEQRYKKARAEAFKECAEISDDWAINGNFPVIRECAGKISETIRARAEVDSK